MIQLSPQHSLPLQNLSSLPPQQQNLIFHKFVPCRQWTQTHSKLAIQSVSYQASSRDQMHGLSSLLDKRLEDRLARTTGICPIRTQLYSQVFDQIIREVALDCPQRGLLLMRVRDEGNMTKLHYRELYESSSEFGRRKCEQSNKQINQLNKTLQELQVRKKRLVDKYITLKSKLEFKRKRIQLEAQERRTDISAEIARLRDEELCLREVVQAIRVKVPSKVISLETDLS